MQNEHLSKPVEIKSTDRINYEQGVALLRTAMTQSDARKALSELFLNLGANEETGTVMRKDVYELQEAAVREPVRQKTVRPEYQTTERGGRVKTDAGTIGTRQVM